MGPSGGVWLVASKFDVSDHWHVTVVDPAKVQVVIERSMIVGPELLLGCTNTTIEGHDYNKFNRNIFTMRLGHDCYTGLILLANDQ